MKEDLCEHVMLHVEGRVPQGCPGYWAGFLNDGFVWCVMAFGRYRRQLGGAGPECAWLM